MAADKGETEDGSVFLILYLHPTSWHRVSSVECLSCWVAPTYIAAQAWPQLRFPSKVVAETAYCSLWKFHNVASV